MLSTDETRFTQFGCGLCAPSQWLNFDVSPAMRLQSLPIIGKLIPSGAFGRYPTNVLYGDIVESLPIPDGSVELLYCSHVLEHMSLEELRCALRNCYRHLKVGGIFRLVVPDLEAMVKLYIHSTEPEAAHEFMRITLLGKEQRRRDLLSFVKDWLAGNNHLWMYDYNSLSMELAKAGFQNIRRARFGDSNIEAFGDVEDPNRWTMELGIHCQKG
ncbi:MULTISPECIES: class I SAM-dependent methyltransferase [Pseudanabaena]|uniref:Methyltransferase type 11 n=2 Tax=Pseudanabaena TaxID=1152 RepID=L8MYQ3_9CYAN|nr:MULTISPECIES: methyltransferase domain-containing protein [Pseudanabaena]ELS31103.1 Methyltransferase type 11 [Pseudanabaena biceps PCC 7429]MDG3496624.1 methyltransferase domain-containing protein [Pseudanabaena catenata USMAC16]